MERSVARVALVMATFVVISFVTNIIDPMGTDVQASFGLSETQVGYLATAIFTAYWLLSIPSGLLVERASPKAVLVLGFLVSGAGAAALAARPSFGMAVGALFVVGAGFALLQVVINPLLRVAGGEEHYAFFGSASQMVFAFGSTVSPHLYVSLLGRMRSAPGADDGIVGALRAAVPSGMPWVALYWLFAALLLAMAVVVAAVRLPRVELAEDEKVGSLGTILALLGDRTVWLYFAGIVSYVGIEQGIATKIKSFLVGVHGVDPDLASRVSVSGFWGAMTVGCAAGLVLLKLFDARKVLVAFMAGGVATLAAALLGSRETALLALPLMGFWCSVGWPLVFSLALNSVERHHGSFAGILCTGIVGGAVMPPLVGRIADAAGPGGLRLGLAAVLVPLAYLVFLGLAARPLVANATLGKSAAPEGGR